MTVIATALKHMLAAGMPHDAIVAAIAEMEASAAPAVDPVAERRREYDRKRKREVRASARVSAVSGGRPVDTADNADAAPLPLPPKDLISNPPTPAPENNTPRAMADAHVAAWQAWRVKNPYPRPHWAEPGLWADFMAVRKRKGATNTKTAHDKLIRDVTEMSARTRWPPGRVLRACVEQGWKGIYETDEMKAAINGNSGNRRGSGSGSSGGHDNRDGLARALDEQIERSRGGPIGRSGAGDAGGTGKRALAGPAALP